MAINNTNGINRREEIKNASLLFLKLQQTISKIKITNKMVMFELKDFKTLFIVCVGEDKELGSFNVVKLLKKAGINKIVETAINMKEMINFLLISFLSPKKVKIENMKIARIKNTPIGLQNNTKTEDKAKIKKEKESLFFNATQKK